METKTPMTSTYASPSTEVCHRKFPYSEERLRQINAPWGLQSTAYYTLLGVQGVRRCVVANCVTLVQTALSRLIAILILHFGAIATLLIHRQGP